jgi:hypothetical protein
MGKFPAVLPPSSSLWPRAYFAKYDSYPSASEGWGCHPQQRIQGCAEGRHRQRPPKPTPGYGVGPLEKRARKNTAFPGAPQTRTLLQPHPFRSPARRGQVAAAGQSGPPSGRYLLVRLHLQLAKKIGGPLGMRGGAEDRPLVILQHLQP